MEELVDVSVVTDGGRRGNVSPKTNITLHLKQAKSINLIPTIPFFILLIKKRLILDIDSDTCNRSSIILNTLLP